MRRFLCLVMGLALVITSYSQTLYHLNFQDVNGNNISLNSLQGKKILFVIAPVHQHDSSKIQDMVEFKNLYGDSVKLIGILSHEDGYADSIRTNILSMYQASGLDIVLTTPMHTRKGSASQSALTTWLTTRSQNKRYDMDVLGTFQKFFVDKTGKLYEVLQTEMPLSSEAAKKAMQRKN